MGLNVVTLRRCIATMDPSHVFHKTRRRRRLFSFARRLPPSLSHSLYRTSRLQNVALLLTTSISLDDPYVYARSTIFLPSLFPSLSLSLSLYSDAFLRVRDFPPLASFQSAGLRKHPPSPPTLSRCHPYLPPAAAWYAVPR